MALARTLFNRIKFATKGLLPKAKSVNRNSPNEVSDSSGFGSVGYSYDPNGPSRKRQRHPFRLG